MDYVAAYKKFERCLYLIEDVGRIATIVAMTLLVALQVVLRIFFKWSSPALEESARFIMIWSIFIGAIVTTREDGHIRMGGVFNSGVKKLWFELISTAVCLGFMIVFVIWSYEFAIYSIDKSMRSMVLRMPLIVVHSCFFVCGFFIVFHFLVHFLNRAWGVYDHYRGGSA
jgi:TRAP-type transport system small permease protein